MQLLFDHLTESQANIICAVLSSAGIFYRVDIVSNRRRIRVRREDLDAARRAMAVYHVENPTMASDLEDRAEAGVSAGWKAGILPSALLSAVHAAVRLTDSKRALVDVYGASASRIVDGEIYRTITALLLHGDSAHLLGNIAGITVFGTAVVRLAGWGVGWLLIVLCGGIGNLLNAYFYRSGHISIGASTAVFAAIGILSGGQFFRKSGRRRSWIYLGAGFALIAVLGAGTESDVMAHAFGFGVGFPAGALMSGLYAAVKFPTHFIQALCLVLTVVLIGVCLFR